ncbi:DUF2970 domain-containing protein [Salinispirillum sp. LH 10-3-1]|uniref:DUF2970 domain-containing protein n=1 Tax=Salinispirillum sp. LH 10-3-1 TaxID=2952525 RepID=A0AB38YBU4_9GAMM
MVEDNTLEPQKAANPPGQPSWWRVIKSVLAAFLGVQSKKNWEEDSKSSSPLRFIVVGLILGFLFFALMFLLVYIVSLFIDV